MSPLLLVTLSLAVAVSADNLLVNTTYGLVQGHFDSTGVKQWLGVPFASPPIGSLRFRPPVPPAVWSDVHDAKAFGPACLQDGDQAKLIGTQSEDCLYLNVFAPNTSVPSPTSLLPVMVWVHGGSFVSGAGSLFVYNGANMATKGNMIVVTINYRLGVLGWMSNSQLETEDPSFQSSGNYGLLDQIAALKWVQANIAPFGGDPNQVTIFGESAGSISICLHLVSPLAKGLFHRAIMESGPCLQGRLGPGKYPLDYAAAKRASETFIQQVGCHNDDKAAEIACLRAFNATSLMEQQPPVSPVTDGVVIVEDPLKTFVDGRQQLVDVFVGSVIDEGSMFVGSPNMTQEQYEGAIRVAFLEHADDILAMYPASSYSSPFWAASAVQTDYFFYCPGRRLMQLHARQAGLNIYQYLFAHTPSWVKCPGYFCPEAQLGVYHSSELYFVFGNPIPFLGPFTPEEQVLSDTMVKYWTHFGATGSPDADYPAYDLTKEQYVVLNVSSVYAQTGYKDNYCNFWDKLTPQ